MHGKKDTRPSALNAPHPLHVLFALPCPAQIRATICEIRQHKMLLSMVSLSSTHRETKLSEGAPNNLLCLPPPS